MQEATATRSDTAVRGSAYWLAGRVIGSAKIMGAARVSPPLRRQMKKNLSVFYRKLDAIANGDFSTLGATWQGDVEACERLRAHCARLLPRVENWLAAKFEHPFESRESILASLRRA